MTGTLATDNTLPTMAMCNGKVSELDGNGPLTTISGILPERGNQFEDMANDVTVLCDQHECLSFVDSVFVDGDHQ